MTKLRVNAPTEQATPLLERYAALAGELATAEAARDEAIATTAAVADKIVLPIIDEMAAIRAELEPWWKRMGATLLKGKRKSIELAGCIIGSKKAGAKLAFAHGDDEAALAALQEHRWAKSYVRIATSVDKTATKAGLDGEHGDQLKALGFSIDGGTEEFVLDRVKQPGVLSEQAAA